MTSEFSLLQKADAGGGLGRTFWLPLASVKNFVLYQHKEICPVSAGTISKSVLNVNGKLSDERFYKLSDGYEAEQKQLEQEIEILTAEVSEADTEVTNVAKLIAVTKKYTHIEELTPEILNAFVDKIVIHERVKQDGKRTQAVDIYYSYVGIVDVPTDEEMRAMEQEYMKRTNLQTA